MVASDQTIAKLVKLILRYVPYGDLEKFQSDLAGIPGNASFRATAAKLIASLREERETRALAPANATTTTIKLLWDRPPHAALDTEYADAAGIGRYTVRRRFRGAREFVVLLNGVDTKYYGTKEECKKSVQRVVTALSLKAS